MNKINEQLFNANVELVEKNKLLEEDKKILIKRINKALEYIETLNEYGIGKTAKKELLDILKGRYVQNE